MKRLILALAMVALLALPAFASVQNVRVGGDISATWLIRDNFSLTKGFTYQGTTLTSTRTDTSQNLFLSQTRLRVDADLTDNVSTTVALINERDWTADYTGTSSEVDINLAYVTLREMLYSPLTVTVGRQLLSYGNSFVIGAGGPNNTAEGRLSTVAADLSKRRAKDAVKLVLDYNPLTIDAFFAKVDAKINTGQPLSDDIDLYGINANYKLNDKFNSLVETYFFAKIDQSTKTTTGTAEGLEADTLYVPGVRASTNPIKGLNLQGEFAWQGGNKATTHTAGTNRADNIRRNAFGAQVIANYALPFSATEKYKPVLQSVYTFVSGDKNLTNGREDTAASSGNPLMASRNLYSAWDPMFEDQAGGKVYNALFDLTNSHILGISAQVSPIEDLTAKVEWAGIWLDKKVQTDRVGTAGAGVFNLRQPDQTARTTPKVTNKGDVGYEIDGSLTYDYTEDVQLGFTTGWFVPGDFFDKKNNEVARQFLTSVNVAF